MHLDIKRVTSDKRKRATSDQKNRVTSDPFTKFSSQTIDGKAEPGRSSDVETVRREKIERDKVRREKMGCAKR